MYKRVSPILVMMLIMVLILTGCTSQAGSIGFAKEGEKPVDTGFTVAEAGSYDSADTAVVLSVDEQNKGVTFLNMETGRQYTLYYDGTTYIKNKHEGPMTISQIKEGDIVDVCFLKGKRRIASLQISPKAWVYDDIQKYDLGGINKTASIGSTTYSLPDDVVVLSGGERVEVMDIVNQDVVTIRGIDHDIYSINIEKGHGYLRLKNDQALIGGWIEVGGAVIREVTEDMLLAVPEGSYQVVLSNEGVSCIKEVTIERDKEVVLDVGDIEIAQNGTGKILFSVTPSDAKVTIDHETVDISKEVELPYGIHQIHLEADGYDSLTKYIQVGSEYARISFTLEEKEEVEEEEEEVTQTPEEDSDEEEEDEEKEEEKDSVSENDLYNKYSVSGNSLNNKNSVSGNSLSTKSGNKVYIDSPRNVEVYLDGNYVGIAPVRFSKRTGGHTVTLRSKGYQTKSYTIYLYDDGEDITYSFTDLVKEVSAGQTGNKISISVTEPEEVKVYVDDEDYGFAPVSFKKTAGEYKIRLEKEGYQTLERTITAKDDGIDNTYEYKLEVCTHEEYEETVTKEPTCGNVGEKKYTCTKCPHSYTEEIEATGEHDYGEDGKCKVCGKELEEQEPPHKHDYKLKETAATCTTAGKKEYICSCGAVDDTRTVVLDALGHNFENGECTTCHAKDPGYENPDDPPCEHDYVGDVTKPATCTEAGTVLYTCSLCGNKYEETIPAGHIFVNGVCERCQAKDQNYEGNPSGSGSDNKDPVTPGDPDLGGTDDSGSDNQTSDENPVISGNDT